MTAGAPVSPLPAGKNFDAGRIHSAQADEVYRVEPPKAAETKKKDIPEGMSFFLPLLGKVDICHIRYLVLSSRTQ